MHDVPGRNKNAEKMIELCVEQEMMIGNTIFKKDIHKYTW